MTELEKAARQALEALEETRNALAWFCDSYPEDVTPKGNELLPHVEVVLADLRVALTSNSRALEQPAQQEPVGVVINEKVYSGFGEHRPVKTVQWRGTPPPAGANVYTSPPAQRKPLTLGQKQRLWSSVGDKPTLKDRVNAYGLAIEAAHGIKEKNT